MIVGSGFVLEDADLERLADVLAPLLEARLTRPEPRWLTPEAYTAAGYAPSVAAARKRAQRAMAAQKRGQAGKVKAKLEGGRVMLREPS
jgi:hypothetical protein